MTVNEKTWRQLAMSWGVTPVMCEIYPSTDVLFYSAVKVAKSVMKLQKDDTSLIKIETI